MKKMKVKVKEVAGLILLVLGIAGADSPNLLIPTVFVLAGCFLLKDCAKE